jgi:hypothetical protein
LLETLADGSWTQGASEILIVGDSQLIIDFASRRSRPGKASLFLALRRI